MIWLASLLIVVLGLALRANMILSAENVRLTGQIIVARKQRRDADAERSALIIRNRDLARENNRMAQGLRQRPRLPQRLVDQIDYADSENSVRLDVDGGIGKCICIPVATWASILQSIREAA